MRPIFLVVTVAAVAVVAFGLARRGEDAVAPNGTVGLLGDSLNVGIEPYVGDALPGWRVVADDMVGRTTTEGIDRLRTARATLAPYLVVSLGTNDPDGAASTFRADVRRLLRLAGPDRCVIWATIWRFGHPDDAFNAVLRSEAEENKRLRLVDWAGMVKRRPELLAPDGLHGNSDGYRERADAVAAAVGSCVPAPTLTQR
jgi:lysophospholipase L1-like esterase